MDVARFPETGTPPLSSADHIALDRALRRLHEAMRAFWNAWPLERRNPSQLSRELNVDRTTCQRLSTIVRTRYVPEVMLENMPGPKALRGVIDSCESAGSPPTKQVLNALRSAVDGFDQWLRDSAGSMSQLKRRLAAGGLPEVNSVNDEFANDVGPQKALFEAARALTRRHSQTTASVGLYDSVGVAENELRHVRISGNHGMIAQPNAVPMVLEAFDGVGETTEDGWQRTPALLREYTSADWNTVQLRPSPGFASTAMEIERSEKPSDVYIYTKFPVPDPKTLDDPIEESWFILYSPTKTLVFDLYLHESIARQCLVSLDVHLWQTSFANSPHGKWHTRMPQTPTITQLGRGMHNAESSYHPRHVDITREMFKIADADPAKYIGYRCIEHFPIWRAGYRFELDFGGT